MDLSANAQKIFDLVKELSAVELAGLVKALEEEFGVTAAAVAVAGAAASADADQGGAEKDTFTIELVDAGQQKIAVIKEVKEILWLGLKEAKELVEAAPKVLKENVKTEEAEAIKNKLEAAGAKIILK